MRKGLLFAIATVVASLAVAIPAQSDVRDHVHYSDSFTDDFTECGFSIHIDGVASGNASARIGKDDLDTAFFGLDNYEYSVRWTNTANGKFFTQWGNGLLHDVSATHVSGSIFRFTTVESGRPYNIVDSSGRTIVRDRGAIRQTYLFDTEGDDTPGGVFLDLLAERVSGPHPGFFQSEAEFCAMVTQLLA